MNEWQTTIQLELLLMLLQAVWTQNSRVNKNAIQEDKGRCAKNLFSLLQGNKKRRNKNKFNLNCHNIRNIHHICHQSFEILYQMMMMMTMNGNPRAIKQKQKYSVILLLYSTGMGLEFSSPSFSSAGYPRGYLFIIIIVGWIIVKVKKLNHSIERQIVLSYWNMNWKKNNEKIWIQLYSDVGTKKNDNNSYHDW